MRWRSNRLVYRHLEHSPNQELASVVRVWNLADALLAEGGFEDTVNPVH